MIEAVLLSIINLLFYVLVFITIINVALIIEIAILISKQQ